ncbi:MAG: threonine synthase [Caldisericia bacterium]|nr:threonine synthase [Caldisericia bacterium]
MRKIKFLKCILCGNEYKETEVKYTCPKCGKDGILFVELDYENIDFKKEKLKDRPNNILRYHELLPINNIENTPPLNVGMTPLYKSKRLNEFLGLTNLYIKDDGRNPTASFKDRASFIVVIKAIELGYDSITTASTGNAASSVAGIAASVGIKTYIFVPETAPRAKIAQLLAFGAKVFAVKGSYDDCFDLCIKASEEFGWYNRNTAYNPYTIEGKKSVSFELWEQLGFEVPDKIFVSVGDGVIYSGVYKGFYDLYKFKLIDKIPQVIGVQAEGASPIVKAYIENKEKVEPINNPKTVADSICVGYPRNGNMALKLAKEYNGIFISVKDEEILNAIPLLGKLTGIFGEPAGVTSLAGLIKMKNENKINEHEKIVVIISGNGLKDIESAIKSTGEPNYINLDIKEIRKIIL